MWNFADMQRCYRERDLPWEAGHAPPPEVIELADRLPAGRMLDLGCGGGRACLFLAQKGWQCTGVDIVPEAIDLAQERTQTAGLTDAIQFYVSSVTMLDFLHTPFDLALDVGCMHALTGADLSVYAAGVARLVRPGGTYLLFGRTRSVSASPDTPGQSEATIRALFEPWFFCNRVEHGITHIRDQTAPTAWYWMTRSEEVFGQD